jgi:hypothetical protein
MERVEKGRTERGFLRILPYLVAILVVLAIEFLYFGTGLPLTMVIFMIVAVLAMGVFLLKPYLAVLALFTVKPILDMMWGVDVGGMKGTYIIGVLGPLLWAFGMLYFRISPLNYRLGRVMIFWGGCCLIPLILAPVSWSYYPGNMWMAGINMSMRLVNGWGFFFLIPFLVKEKRDFNLFLYAWLASTVIPALLGLYYLVTSNPVGFQITAGWWRIAGPYHDAAAFMTEITPGLPIMLYLASGTKRWWKRVLWLIPVGAWLFLVFNAYTRSFWIATSIVLVLWVFARLWQPAAVAAIGALYKWPLIWKRFTTAGVEDLESTYALGGRVGLWEDFWRVFKQSTILDKILGGWAGIKGFEWLDYHSQYLITVDNMGLVGLAGFISILVGFLYHLIRDLFTHPAWRREALLGLSVLTMVVVLSASGRFLMVPNNQWFFFGFMGLIINRNSDAWTT